MELVYPWFVDEINDRAMSFIGGRGEDADGFVEEKVARGAGLENFSLGREMIEFSEREIAIGDEFVVKEDLSGF